MDTKEILKLAELARLNITEVEAEAYKKDFEGILNYLDSIKEVNIDFDGIAQTNLTTNSMRDDEEFYTPGSFTEDILAEAPEREGDYIKVKKVL